MLQEITKIIPTLVVSCTSTLVHFGRSPAVMHISLKKMTSTFNLENYPVFVARSLDSRQKYPTEGNDYIRSQTIRIPWPIDWHLTSCSLKPPLEPIGIVHIHGDLGSIFRGHVGGTADSLNSHYPSAISP